MTAPAAANMDVSGDSPVPDEVHQALGLVAAAEGFLRPRFHVESGSNLGDGYMSFLYRAVIRNEDGAPSSKGHEKLHLMCKTMMPSTKGSILVEHVFKVEDVMYTSALPAMEDIALLKDPLPWPRGYPSLAAGSGESSMPCLVMEDLRPAGFVMATPGTVLGEPHCRLVLTQLARYHGAGMALQHVRPDHFAHLRQQLENMAVFDAVRENLKAFLQAGETASDFLTDRYPEGSSIHDKVKKLCSNFTVEFFTHVAPHPDGGNTFVHGDCHMKNVMWQHDKASGEVTGCRLIDFQGARFGYPTADLLVLLLSGTEKAMRDQHWQALMRCYHTELQSTLHAAGCEDPDAIYSWDRFQAQLRRASTIALCMVPLMIHGFNDEDAIKDIQDTVAQMTAVEGHPQPPQQAFRVAATPLLKRRYCDVVQDFIEWGWL